MNKQQILMEPEHGRIVRKYKMNEVQLVYPFIIVNIERKEYSKNLNHLHYKPIIKQTIRHSQSKKSTKLRYYKCYK